MISNTVATAAADIVLVIVGARNISVYTEAVSPTFRGDFIPGAWWIHKRCILYLVSNLFVFVEREGTAEAAAQHHKG